MTATPSDSLMRKELREQPDALQRLLSDAARPDFRHDIARAAKLLTGAEHVALVGCGSSYHAAAAAAHAFRDVAQVPATTFVASEVVSDPTSLAHCSHVIAVSQSGHTADTLEALHVVKARGLGVVVVVADGDAPMARLADVTLVTRSGAERAIPSTKGFTCQLATLWLLVAAIAEGRALQPAFATALHVLPATASATLACEDAIAAVAQRIAHAESHVFLGTGPGFAIACEGALKMKESARVPAQAYPSFEVRHGPLAALGQQTPVLLYCTDAARADATRALAMHLRHCAAPVVLFASHELALPFQDVVDHIVTLPDASQLLAPMVGGIAYQLLAYHTARALERDMDAPPNLVKSVV